MCNSIEFKTVKVPVLLLIEMGQVLSQCILRSDFSAKHDKYLKRIEYYVAGCVFRKEVEVPINVIEEAIKDFRDHVYYIDKLKELLPKEEYFAFPNPVCEFAHHTTKEAPFMIGGDDCDTEDLNKCIIVMDSLYTVEISPKYKKKGYTMIKFKKRS